MKPRESGALGCIAFVIGLPFVAGLMLMLWVLRKLRDAFDAVTWRRKP